MSEPRGSGPAVRFPPPLLYAAGFLVGWLLDARVYHLWPSLHGTADTILSFVGGALLGGGIAIAVSGIVTFRRARTTIIPHRAAAALVRSGPYRATRNPMYLGLALAYVGTAIIIGAGWPIIVLPIVIVAMRRFVIDREERYLTAAFGDEYRAYQAEVGRWW